MAEKLPKKSGTIGLGLLLRRANKSFAGAMAAQLAKAGVTHAQFHHLRRLNETDGISSSELSARVEVTKATSTAILDALENKGLIRRERDPGDRRRVNVYLTEAGRAIQAELEASAEKANCIASRHLSAEEHAQLFDLLERTVQSLTEAPQSGSDADG